MLIQGLIFRACTAGANVFKTPLCSRLSAPFYQQYAGAKTIESELGLPEKPKRPAPLFMQFLKTRRAKYSADNPGLPPKDIVKLISKEWKTCDESEKRKLEEQLQMEAAEYAVKLENYLRLLSKEDQEAIKEVKAKKREQKAAREQNQKLKKLNKPKKPLNAYLLFYEDQTAQGSYKDVPFKDKSKKCSEVWKKAPEETVAKYREKAAEARKKYQRDLEVWEERMVALGYIDVIYEGQNKSKKET